jgi:hypothetical protein
MMESNDDGNNAMMEINDGMMEWNGMKWNGMME